MKELTRREINLVIIAVVITLLATLVVALIFIGCSAAHADTVDGLTIPRHAQYHLNIGEPRTVRMIHFVPDGASYSARVHQDMRRAIRQVQSFYTEQMPRPIIIDGTGSRKKDAFRIETNQDDELIIHRINGKYPDSYYRDKHYSHIFEVVWKEVIKSFHVGSNIYLVVISNGSSMIGSVKGVGGRSGKVGGMALVSDDFTWDIVAHELGHAFGLKHDFRDNKYIMAYGSGDDRILSSCNARFLSRHPYFNDSSPLIEGLLPTIKMTTEDTYPAAAESVSVRFAASDEDSEIHQVLAFSKTKRSGFLELLACSGGRGRPSFSIQFNYDGTSPSNLDGKLSDTESHRLYVQAIDKDGDVSESSFTISQIPMSLLTTIESDDNYIHTLAFSPNGRQIAVIGDNLHLWNNAQPSWHLPGLRKLYTVRDLSKYVGGSYDDGRTNFTHSYGAVFWDLPFALRTPNVGINPSMFFSSDGTRLASTSKSAPDVIELWDTTTGEHMRTIEHRQGSNRMLFSPDATILACEGMELSLWDVATGELIMNITKEPNWYGFHYFNSLAFSPDGNVLAARIVMGSRSLIQLWNITTGEVLNSFHIHDGNNSSRQPILFSPDGMTLAIMDVYGLKLWDVATVSELSRIKGVYGDMPVAFSPDGMVIASGKSHGNVEIWDVSKWKELRPHNLVKIAGDNQQGVPGIELPNPLVVKVMDMNGDPYPEAQVTFTVVSGGGWLDDAVVEANVMTDDNGQAECTFVVGPYEGTHTIDVFMGNRKFAVFHTEAVRMPIGLLPNYPNPFNPETWIPFRLAEDVDVTLTIYGTDGRIVRTLDIGHRRAGVYQSRDKAIYWDGKNDLGENVASGVYFYHLTAGGYSATKRMVILK